MRCSMLLELKQLFQIEGTRLEINTDFDWSDKDLGGICPFTSPVKVRGEIFNRTGLVTLTACN